MDLTTYVNYLIEQEKNEGTIEKYTKDILEFFKWKKDNEISKTLTIQYKNYLLEKGLEKTTINSKLSSINGYFKYIERPDACVKFLKIQNKVFRAEEKELTIEEYKKLIEKAYEIGNERLAIIIQTIGSTGIRVSELKYITVETVDDGVAEIHLKGKDRVILIPKSMRKKLKAYCKKNKIKSGEIFITKNGNSLNRKQIWQEMKNLCEKAGISKSKVFPHNLRHLFAMTFYKKTKDVVKLADILGHSSINTTRVYLLSTGHEHMRLLESLKLVY